MRVMLVYDVNGWAFHHMAVDLSRHAPEGVVGVPVCQTNFPPETSQAWDRIDAAFFFSWASGMPHFCRNKPSATLVTSAGILYDRNDESDWNTRIVTDSRNSRKAAEKLPTYKAVLCANPALHLAASKIHANVHHTPIGVNDDLFRPAPRLMRDGPLRVGWCANPGGVRSVKGMNEILVPLMNRLGNTDYEWVINARNHSTAMTREQMVEWYRLLDVFLCTSINEGSPNTIFEAAACGIPVISTAVGMADGWRRARELGLIVPAYRDQETAKETIVRFVEWLERFRKHRSNCSVYGLELRKSVEQVYSWRHLAERWFEAIATAVTKGNAP